MKTRVGIIFGGRSGEHDISIRSAAKVIECLDAGKYSPIPVAIDQSGKWLDLETSLGLLPTSAAERIEKEDLGRLKGPIALIGDPRYQGLVELAPAAGEKNVLRLDVVFPVLHGPFGEDGSIQGLLEMSSIPYVGCGVLASSCGMDKVAMKILLANAGLPICKYVWFLRSEWETAPEQVSDSLVRSIGLPFFVKPANLGSSVGISRVDDASQIQDAIRAAAAFDRKIIVEEALEMREIECAVLGNSDPKASLPGEYLIRKADKAFLDYEEKYSSTGNNEFIVPSPLSSELTAKVQEMAVDAFKAIDGSGLARVDFFLRKDNGTLLVNEINTMPGLTSASGFPKMWEASGLEMGAVVDKLISLAIERNKDQQRNRSSR